jgi:hypothetical protein
VDGETTTTRLEETDRWAIELSLVITATDGAYATGHPLWRTGSVRRSLPRHYGAVARRSRMPGNRKIRPGPGLQWPIPKSIPADPIVTACQSATAREMMQHRKEAPSMYEMEGASKPSGADGPIARPAKPRSTPPSVGKA